MGEEGCLKDIAVWAGYICYFHLHNLVCFGGLVISTWLLI